MSAAAKVAVTEKSNVSQLEATLYYCKLQKRRYNDLLCLMCGDEAGGKQGFVQRQNTRYVHDLSNWTCLCDECAKENSNHWRDMWEEYYANCM